MGDRQGRLDSTDSSSPCRPARARPGAHWHSGNSELHGFDHDDDSRRFRGRLGGLGRRGGRFGRRCFSGRLRHRCRWFGLRLRNLGGRLGSWGGRLLRRRDRWFGSGLRGSSRFGGGRLGRRRRDSLCRLAGRLRHNRRFGLGLRHGFRRGGLWRGRGWGGNRGGLLRSYAGAVAGVGRRDPHDRLATLAGNARACIIVRYFDGRVTAFTYAVNHGSIPKDAAPSPMGSGAGWPSWIFPGLEDGRYLRFRCTLAGRLRAIHKNSGRYSGWEECPSCLAVEGNEGSDLPGRGELQKPGRAGGATHGRSGTDCHICGTARPPG